MAHNNNYLKIFNFGRKSLLLFTLIIVLLIISPLCYSEVFHNPEIGYYLDVPVGWTLVDSENLAFIAFSNTSSSAVMQVFGFPGNAFDTADNLYQSIKLGLNAEGDGIPFTYSGREAVFSDLIFNAASSTVRGYFVFVNSAEMDYVIIAYSQIEVYEANHDFLLSCIDTFAINEEEKYVPGPISQFFYPFPGKNREIVEVEMNGIKVQTEIDLNELDAAAVLIEREARILITYTDYNEFVEAWRRYYRIIYKDNYLRLGGISALLENNYRLGQKSTKDRVLLLLGWIQNFEYYRTGTNSDLTSPVETAYSMAGDCDSRALLFIIMLNYFNIDSILLVSTEYSHSAVGVDIHGNGAKIRFNNKDYLFAELTDVVDIGLIDSTMADPEGWISIPLRD